MTTRHRGVRSSTRPPARWSTRAHLRLLTATAALAAAISLVQLAPPAF